MPSPLLQQWEISDYFPVYMATNIIKELEAARAKVAALEESLQSDLKHKLAGLPAEYGFTDLKAFIKALKAASGRGAKGKAPQGKKGKRARITPEVKAQVKELVGQEKTGAQIAKQLGISLPSVQNIKKELGLVKARKKK
jgi:hypothetical protein